MTQSVDRLLSGLLVLLLLLAAAGAVPGLYMAGTDLQTSGEFLDGLGTVLGLGIVGMVAVPAGAAVMAIRALHRGRSSSRAWAVVAGALGTLAVLPFGFVFPPLFAALVLPLLVVAVVVLEGRAHPLDSAV